MQDGEPPVRFELTSTPLQPTTSEAALVRGQDQRPHWLDEWYSRSRSLIGATTGSTGGTAAALAARLRENMFPIFDPTEEVACPCR